MSEEGNIVPFGKYRGQPVAVMMADQDYCAWAMSQPGIRERYASLFTVIINGGVAPDSPTPEHNRMQLLFRDQKLRSAAYRSILKQEGIDRASWRCRPDDRCTTAEAARQFDEFIERVDAEFEMAGWDVVLGADVAIELKPAVGDDYPAILRAMKARRRVDEYGRHQPLQKYLHRALIVDHFEAEGATLDDVKWLFGRSGIEVRTLAEIGA